MGTEIWLSASKISIGLDCPRRLYLQYVAKTKVPQKGNAAAFVGTAFHYLMENMYAKKIWDMEKVLALTDEAWRDAVAQNLSSPLKEADSEPDKIAEYKEKIKKYFKKTFKHYKEKNLIDNPELEVITEQKFEIRTPSEKSKGIIIVLNGFIDRITIWKKEMKAWITDYKTTSEIPTQEKVNKDKQLTMYAVAYRHMAKNRIAKDWPEKESFVELFFPKIADRLKAKRKKEDFIELREVLEKVLAMQITKQKNATPSNDACKFCPYKFTEYCPESREYVYESR